MWLVHEVDPDRPQNLERCRPSRALGQVALAATSSMNVLARGPSRPPDRLHHEPPNYPIVLVASTCTYVRTYEYATKPKNTYVNGGVVHTVCVFRFVTYSYVPTYCTCVRYGYGTRVTYVVLECTDVRTCSRSPGTNRLRTFVQPQPGTNRLRACSRSQVPTDDYVRTCSRSPGTSRPRWTDYHADHHADQPNSAPFLVETTGGRISQRIIIRPKVYRHAADRCASRGGPR